jgi:hypothetical protein
MARKVLPRDRSLKATNGAGEETDAVYCGRNFVPKHEVQGLSAVERLKRGVVRGRRLYTVGEFQEEGGAFRRRGSRPAVERARRRCDSLVDLGRGGFGNLGEQLACARIDQALWGADAHHIVCSDPHRDIHLGFPIA